MPIKRRKSPKKVTRSRRVYTVRTVTKTVRLCERPYVLFGEAVRAERQKRGMTQEDLAVKVGLGRPSIANIELGYQRILLSDVFVFADALRVRPRALFDAVQS